MLQRPGAFLSQLLMLWTIVVCTPSPLRARDFPPQEETSVASDDWVQPALPFRSGDTASEASGVWRLNDVPRSDDGGFVQPAGFREGMLFDPNAPYVEGGPDISEPGPDMGDFPNSAFTLKKGRSYVEFSPATYSARNSKNAATYSTPFLLRYGVTDDVEFRLIGNGITTVSDPTPSTGVGVLVFDTKIHMWDDKMEYFIPAASFEAFLQTDLGSPVYQSGTQPSININMDFPFTDDTNFELTVGYSGSLMTVAFLRGAPLPLDVRRRGEMEIPVNTYTFSLQWALEQDITDQFQLFLHGYYNQPIESPYGASVVVGTGFFYELNQRTIFFGSLNAGLSDIPAPVQAQFGLALAF